MSKGKLIGGALAAMIAIATPLFVSMEGEELSAYKDVVGVVTICSGDTRNVYMGMRLTKEQCRQRTDNILNEYGTDVQKLSPGIENSPYEWAAHTIFAANIGVGAYGRSSIRRLYNAGDYRGACRAMRLYDKAGGRVIRGLVNRREGTATMIGEYELCLGGAIARTVQ